MRYYSSSSIHIKEDQYCIRLVRFLLILYFGPSEVREHFPMQNSMRLTARYEQAARDICSQPVLWRLFLHQMCYHLQLCADSFLSHQNDSTEPSLIVLMEEWNRAVRIDSLRDRSILLLSMLHRRGRCPTKIYARLNADCEVLTVRMLRQNLIA